jgi:hypothetical protein
LLSARPGRLPSIQLCGRWILSHGLSLLLIARTVFLLGLAMPAGLSELAEKPIGVI